MWAKSRPKHVEEINILRKIVHQVDFTYKIISRLSVEVYILILVHLLVLLVKLFINHGYEHYDKGVVL